MRMAVRTPAASATARRSQRVDMDEEDGSQDGDGEYDSEYVATS